jgi:hypothetical protein
MVALLLVVGAADAREPPVGEPAPEGWKLPPRGDARGSAVWCGRHVVAQEGQHVLPVLGTERVAAGSQVIADPG